jgi:hypothetical protein
MYRSGFYFFVSFGSVRKINSEIRLLVWIAAVSLVSCNPQKRVDYWDIIDSNSTFIYETVSTPQADSALAPFFRVSATSFIIALQSIGKKEADLLYAYRIPEREYTGLVSSAVINKKVQRLTNRVYNGNVINEIRTLPDNKIVLAFSYQQDIVILSRSPILVENALRISELPDYTNYRSSNPSLFQFASLKSDAGNLYLNFNSVVTLGLVTNPNLNSIPLFKEFARSAVLDVKTNKEKIAMNGFTVDSIRRNFGLSRFQQQHPVKNDVMRFIPFSTNWVVHYGISDWNKFVLSKDTAKFFFADEVAVCESEESGSSLIFVKVREAGIPEIDTYIESYSGYELSALQEFEFLKPLNQLLPADSVAYVTRLENYLVFSRSISSLKALIDEIEADDTWGKSLAFQEFLGRGLRESNVSIFFKNTKWSPAPTDRWKPVLDSMRISSLAWGSIQFSALDDHFYTSVNLEPTSPDRPGSRTPAVAYQLSNAIARAFPVKNHTNSKSELIVQDSTHQISLFSSENGILWSYVLDGAIHSLTQVDLYKNAKFQYFIVTPTSLYVIDRLGRDVSGFPKRLSFNSRFATVVDYDKSRNYRYLLTTPEKEVFILDKSAKPLADWSPKRIGSTISNPPEHYRIGGSDYFLFLTEDQTIHLVNRKGNNIPGFPIKLRGKVSGEYFVDVGTSLSGSYLYFTSNAGQVTKMSLDSKSLTTEDLVRGTNSQFSLIRPYSTSQTFYYSRIDTDKIAIFDAMNKLIFERQNPGSIKLQPSVIVLAQDRAVFNYYDPEQNLSYLFDQTGTMITKPVESTIMPVFGVNVKSRQAFIYSFNRTIVTTTALR